MTSLTPISPAPRPPLRFPGTYLDGVSRVLPAPSHALAVLGLYCQLAGLRGPCAPPARQGGNKRTCSRGRRGGDSGGRGEGGGMDCIQVKNKKIKDVWHKVRYKRGTTSLHKTKVWRHYAKYSCLHWSSETYGTWVSTNILLFNVRVKILIKKIVLGN